MKKSPKNIDFFSEWLSTVNQIIEKILTNQDIDLTTEFIMKILEKHLTTQGGIYLKLQEDHLVLNNYTVSNAVKIFLKRVPFDIWQLKYPLSAKNALITKVITEKKMVLADKLEDFFYPVFKPLSLLRMGQKILGIKLSVGLPVKIGDEIIGAFFFSTRQKELTDIDIKWV